MIFFSYNIDLCCLKKNCIQKVVGAPLTILQRHDRQRQVR